MDEIEESKPSVDYILEKIRPTQHAKERYAERIMGKEGLADIKKYVLENEKKIKTDLSKMLAYGKVIYSGKPLNDTGNTKNVEIFLTGTWILFVEAGTYKVITLYKIDFSLGEDFNKQYVELFVEKINDAKDELEGVKEKTSDKVAEIQEKISYNNAVINEYRELLNLKESENAGLKEIMSATKAEEIAAEMKVRELIATMINKRSF